MEPVYLFLRGKNRRQGIEQFTYLLPGTAKRYIVTYVYEPHKGSKKENKDMVHEIIGDGQCLGITKDDVNNNIEGNNYDLVARVSNEAGTDSAICTVQYYNWCLDPGYTKPQVWINDLCRLSTVREDPTPVGILLSLIEEKIVSLGRGIDSTWMLIEKKKTDKHDPERLIKIYSEKYGYSLVGEGVGIPPSCLMTENMSSAYYVMRKRLEPEANMAGPAGGAGFSTIKTT